MSCLNCYPPPSTSSTFGDMKTSPSRQDNRCDGERYGRQDHHERAGHDQSAPANTVAHPITQAHNSVHSSSTSSTFSTPIDTPQHSPPKEEHLFANGPNSINTDRYRRQNGIVPSEPDCTACNFSVPKDLTSQLPFGAPGSPKKDGRSSNGSPVLRSREAVLACDGHHDPPQDENDHPPHQVHPTQCSLPISITSNQTTSCHTHTLTYLTTRTSPSPHTYSLLRRASIRTISSELLPRGLSSGPLSFGDPIAGYTIAYVFRVPDPLARGHRRTHALLALAGKDASRAFRASPCVWRAFERIASAIVASAERVARGSAVDEDARTLNNENNTTANAKRHPRHQRTFTPVSSFLSGRNMDPDGYPISGASLWGRSPQKSLAELVGNEYLFAELHMEFVALLQALGKGFGGWPGGDSDAARIGEEGGLGGEGDGEGGDDEAEDEDEDGEANEEEVPSGNVEIHQPATPPTPTHNPSHNPLHKTSTISSSPSASSYTPSSVPIQPHQQELVV
ncbi:MAG: hypothetical protein M1830_006064 [Pleopsidium flavum]|nr:MAG: hypothetical protein M1830_006064 [Pleopsidium flavum]